MTKQIDLDDIFNEICAMDDEINAAKVFINSICDKMDFMAKLCSESELKIEHAKERTRNLQKLLLETGMI